MNIVCNGQPREADQDLTVAGLLEQLELAGRAVAVEVNQQLVPRDQQASRTLRPDDRVEIVTLAGGG